MLDLWLRLNGFEFTLHSGRRGQVVATWMGWPSADR